MSSVEENRHEIATPAAGLQAAVLKLKLQNPSLRSIGGKKIKLLDSLKRKKKNGVKGREEIQGRGTSNKERGVATPQTGSEGTGKRSVCCTETHSRNSENQQPLICLT